jgi:tetratricopeptide (TPR) repeat protein
MPRLFAAGFALLLGAALASPAIAQEEPPRPSLPRSADPNDWEAYFDLGDRSFGRNPRVARAAFYWASRLDPSRAEPLFARWAVFFAGDQGLFIDYLTEEPSILRRPEVVANDSLILRSYRRNPFVHHGLEAALFAMLGRRLQWGAATGAFMEYGAADFDRAAQRFGQIVRGNPGRNVRFRYWRALSFVGAGQLDSASLEIEQLLEVLRQTDAQRLGYYYESKAMYEYALGMLYETRGRPADARAAWERALVEDLSMYPARAALARLALRERRSAEAVEHMAQVVEIAPDDPIMRLEYGEALLVAGRRDEAVAQYRRVIEMEPHYAEPYLRLGLALQAAGDRDGARGAYQAYLDRAPRRLAEDIQLARTRIAHLQPAS